MNHNDSTKPYIPTREEFHRSFSGYICAADFSTVRCIPGSHLNRIAGALRTDRSIKQQSGGNR